MLLILGRIIVRIDSTQLAHVFLDIVRMALSLDITSQDNDVGTPRIAFSMGTVSHGSEFLSTADKEVFYIVNTAGDMIEVEYDYMTSLGTALHRAKKKWLDDDKKLSKCSLVKGNHVLSLEPTGLANQIYEIFDGWPGQKLLTFLVHC